MLYLLLSQSSYSHYYEVSDSDDRTGYDVYNVSGWSFNDQTRQVEYYSGEAQVDPGQSPGEDYDRPTDDEFVVFIDGPTRTGYFHDGKGGVTKNPQTLTLSAVVLLATCYGSDTGAIDLSVGGLPGPYTFQWADGSMAEDRGLVKAGQYTVTVTDASGARLTQTIAVGQNPALEVLVQKAGGDVALLVSGGVGPYTYQWDDGATTADRAGLGSGLYACTITDSVGCTKAVLVNLDANQYFWSGNPITLPLDAGAAYRADPTSKPNLSFLCEVWIEPVYLSEEFVPVGPPQEQPADRDGRTVFEVQALLDKFLQHHVPAADFPYAQRAEAMFRRFYLKYAQLYGPADAPVRDTTATLEQNYVLLGGLNFYESRARTWFNSYQAAAQPFLSWEPVEKYVTADQPEYLYFMVPAGVSGFRGLARALLADGTSELGGYHIINDVRQHEVWCLPVSYRDLNLVRFGRFGPAVVGWEVYVTNAEETKVLSEVRRYHLDPRVYPQRRYFLFATSLGSMATFVATGQAQLEVEVTGEETALTLAADYDPQLGDTAVQQRQLRPVLKVASGLRSRAQVTAAQDLLLSRRVLLLQDARWLPGYIKAKTQPLLDESNPLPRLEFDFYLPYERHYTPRLPSAANAGALTGLENNLP